MEEGGWPRIILAARKETGGISWVKSAVEAEERMGVGILRLGEKGWRIGDMEK